jgi:branched-chain amino acid transport system substrate-binding protein
MRRVSLIILAVVFAMTTLFTGLSYAQKAPYLLGFMSDLTGAYSSLGNGNKRGLDIALERINKAGGINGRQLKAVYYDGETNVAKGILNTKKLIEVDKAVALVGYTSSPVVMAALPMLEDYKIPMISASAPEVLWIPTKKWVFNTVARQKEGSVPVLLDVLKKKGAKKIAYLYSDYLLGQTGKIAFDEGMKEMKMTPAIIEKYPFGNTELGPQITHIKASGADSLLITGLQTDTAAAIKIARDLGFTGPIVCDYAIGSPEFIDLVGKYGEGVVTTAQKALVAFDLPDSDVQKKVAIELNREYTKRYGSYNQFAGHTWDSAHLIAEALKKVDPNLDPTKSSDLAKIREQIRDNLEKIKGFVGQNGVFNYSPDNHNGLGLNCYPPVVIEKGKWRLYKGN